MRINLIIVGPRGYMNRLQTGVPRRTVIEAWLKYDAAKKSITLPDSSAWPWESADGLD
jgi:hypothetical protein